MGQKPEAETCAGMEGLIKEKKLFMREKPSEELLEFYNIGAAQKVERYEITAYESLIDMAEKLGMSDAVELLEQNLQEEEADAQQAEGDRVGVRSRRRGRRTEDEEEETTARRGDEFPASSTALVGSHKAVALAYNVELRAERRLRSCRQSGSPGESLTWRRKTRDRHCTRRAEARGRTAARDTGRPTTAPAAAAVDMAPASTTRSSRSTSAPTPASGVSRGVVTRPTYDDIAQATRTSAT